MKSSIKIVHFPVVIPADYSIAGFRQRNPDNFYKFEETIIDRHFICSEELKPGEKFEVWIEELRDRWTEQECIEYIISQKGFFPNAVGLTLAFEKGEKYLHAKFKRPLAKQQHVPYIIPNIIGLDKPGFLWWRGKNSGGGTPRLRYNNAIMAREEWIFELVSDNYFGNSEDCLLYFTKIEE